MKVIIEGPDFSGKSTLIKNLYKYFPGGVLQYRSPAITAAAYNDMNKAAAKTIQDVCDQNMVVLLMPKYKTLADHMVARLNGNIESRDIADLMHAVVAYGAVQSKFTNIHILTDPEYYIRDLGEILSVQKNNVLRTAGYKMLQEAKSSE